MAGLTRGNIPKEATPVKEVKVETISTLVVSSEMKIIQDIINRNKAEIMRSIEKMGEDQALAALKYERIEFKKNLELAQANIIEMDKYLKLAMETVQKDMTASINEISEKVDKLEASNQVVRTIITTEGKKLTEQSEYITKNLGDNAQKSVTQSLKALDQNFKNILDRHNKIVELVENMCSFKGVRTVGKWFLIITTWTMLAKIIRQSFIAPDTGFFGFLITMFFGWLI